MSDVDWSIEIGDGKAEEWRRRQRAIRAAFETGEGYFTIGDGPPLIPGKDIHLVPRYYPQPVKVSWWRRLLRSAFGKSGEQPR